MKPINRRRFLQRAFEFGTGVLAATTLGIRAAPSSRALAAPPSPALVDAQGFRDTIIQLVWMAVASADSYTIYRNGSAIASQPGTRYTNTGLAPSTTYTYEIAAVAGYSSQRL